MQEFQIIIDTIIQEDIVIEEYKADAKQPIKSEEPISKITPFFYEEYAKADSIITSIIRGNDRLGKGKRENYKFKNNIIVFSGDRGSGKTSAMLSFGEYLAKKDGADKIKFKLLEMIDPSYFRKNESILLNIITIMFKMAKHYNNHYYRNKDDDSIDDYPNKVDFDHSKKSNFNELLRSFEKVFRSVKRMDSIIPKEDSLEYLNELSDAMELNKFINKLIKGTSKNYFF